MAFIEVPHTFHDTQPYKTFNLPNDSSARTLQDLDFPERGGGFGFATSNQLNSNVRNRFLYWRWCNGGLEVLEDSLDTTLRSNWLKFIFSNTCVLHAEAFERDDEVQLLICTATSAMRLLFRHPGSAHKHDGSVGRTAPSIFHEMESLRRSVVPVRALQQSGTLRCATARVRHTDGSALFAFCLTTGSVLLVEMPRPNASHLDEEEPSGARTFELRHSSMMSKLWNGIVPTFASRSDGVSLESATDALFVDYGNQTLLLTVCRDHKLRVWNVETRELVTLISLIDRLDDKFDLKALQLRSAGQGHSLRQSQSGPEKEPVQIGVHLNFVDGSHVLLFSVNTRTQDIHSCLVLQCSIACDHNQDLVDWCLVPSRRQAWFLLQSERGYAVSCRDTRKKGSSGVPGLFLSDVLWHEDEDEGEEGALSCVPAHQDPQEAYLQAVFAPGRFSVIALQRAVTALRQTADHMPLGNIGLAGPLPGSLDALREEIILLVEERIAQTVAEQAAAHELSIGGGEQHEVSEAELLEIRMLHWSDFFASVLDYQRSGVARPVGLLVDRHTGLVGIIRKAGLSLFRQADPVEVCALVPPVQLSPASISSIGKSACTLLRHLHFLQQSISNVAMGQLYAQLETDTEDLSAKAAAFLQECLSLEHKQQMVDRLSATDNLLESFLQLIEIAENLQDADVSDDDIESDDMMVGAYMHPERFLFSSPLAVDLLSRSVDTILTARLRLAVCLLLVQQLVSSQVSCIPGSDWLTSDKPGSSLTSRLAGPLRLRIISLIRNLAFMRWLASARLVTPTSQILDRISSQLNLLGCSHGPKPCSPSSAAQAPADFRRTLLELFFQASSGGDRVRSRLRETGMLDPSSGEGASQLWADVFPVAASCLQARLCPSSAEAVLAVLQFLFSRGQMQAMLKATRLLDSWWQRDPALVSYARGLALLNVGQSQKAIHFFKVALDSLPAVWESPAGCCLPRAALGPKVDLRRPAHLHQVNIALKLMRALEIAEEPLLVVELAHHALSWLQPGDSLRSSFVPLSVGDENEEAESEPLSVEDEEEELRAVLWTSIFKHELAVGRNNEAFNALIKNPDTSSCKDCLRQLIVTLCDRRQLTSLIHFDYGELEEEFVAILESRARAVDLTVYNYYKLLYSFHVEMENYRRAAAVAYEEALRLGLEVRSLSGLQGQARALLAALTALRLVAPSSQWLLRPALEPSTPADRVMELQELLKEYTLIKARLRVAQVDIEHCLLPAGPLTVSDTVRCLLKVGLYNVALELCQLYGEPLHSVFEALSSRCVALPLVTAAATNAQHQRDLQIEKAVLIECLGEVDANGDYEGLPAVQLAWSLLQSYLKLHAAGGYWRCAMAKLLACRHAPPAWLVAEGKRRDRASLLRLFIQNDEVEAAVHLALESIDEAMSRGGGPSVASQDLSLLPHLWVRHLCAALGILAKSNTQCAEMRDQLDAKLNSYYTLLERTAKDKKTMLVKQRAPY